MEKDKLYIDTNNKSIKVELPNFGEIRLIVQGGKVIRTETLSSEKIHGKQLYTLDEWLCKYVCSSDKWYNINS